MSRNRKFTRYINKFRYIVRVTFVNGKRTNYILSSDLSNALETEAPYDYVGTLKGAYINVPIMAYDRNGKAPYGKIPPIVPARIDSIHRTDSTAWIASTSKTTRSQFIKVNKNDNLHLIKNYIKYMKHDYPKLYQLKIENDLKKFLDMHIFGEKLINIVFKHVYNKKARYFDKEVFKRRKKAMKKLNVYYK